jgi:hypothetical protein
MIALPERAPKGPRVARRGILVRGIKNFIRLWHTGIFRSKYDARPAELILDMLFVTRKTDVADNVMQKSNAALREAITNFREKQDAISALNNFEERMASYAQRLQHPSKATVSEEIARKLFEVARDYFFLQRVSELKIGYIVSSIQDAITRDNPTTEFV